MKLQEAICLVGNNFLRQQEEPASLEKLGERTVYVQALRYVCGIH